MKTLTLGLVAVLTFAACNENTVGARSSGSLAASRDDALLYAADTDNGVLGVIELKTNTKLAEVKVGQSPWRVVVGADDTIYVANRGSRSVSVIKRGDWVVAAELPTDVDPVGMVADADGKTLYVVCATSATASEFGTLAAFDTSTLSLKWSLNIGSEPRGIALVEGNRAIISLYREGEVVEVDLERGVLASGARDNLYQAVNRSALTTAANRGGVGGGSGSFGPGTSTFHPRAASDVIATPDGKRVFVTGLLSREAPILTPPSPITPYYKAQGPQLAGSVATGAVFAFDTGKGALSPSVDDLSAPTADSPFPQTSYATSGVASYSYVNGQYVTQPAAVLQGPTVGVVDYSGEWLYVVNRESNTLALISAGRRTAIETPATSANAGCGAYCYISAGDLPSVHSTTSIGSGSDGLVVMGDNLTVYVYSQFDHSVEKSTFDPDSKRITSRGSIATIGQELLSNELMQGRKMFHDATDRRISAIGASVACSSCHLEGRDDGHTWNFPDGPRQTPTLAGRGMLDTAPYHWSGEFPAMKDFLNHTITSRMGGTGIDEKSATAINQFMAVMPPPENPYLKGEVTPQLVRGQQAFAKAQCGSCHSGQWFTNNANTAVGTLAGRDNGLVVKQGLNVPSLKGLARSAPYLHDGSVATLSDRILRNPDDKHGVTSKLSPTEVEDLIAYLRTL